MQARQPLSPRTREGQEINTDRSNQKSIEEQ